MKFSHVWMHVIFDDENLVLIFFSFLKSEFVSVFGLLVLFGRSYEFTAADLNGPDQPHAESDYL